MPAYSFGNRWMGIASLTEPPVPPPLHRLALSQHQAMLRRSDSHLVLLPGGERVLRDAARTYLARMGRGYALAEQWSKSDVCYELWKILQNQDPPEQAWPSWLLRRVLAVADRNRSGQPTRSGAIATTQPHRTLPYPPAALDDVAVPSALLAVLDGSGWQAGRGRFRRAWMTLSAVHTSYLYESETLCDEITPALLGMLATVGTTWTGLAALDLQIQADPSSEVGDQSAKFAGIRTVLPGAIADLLNVAGAGLFGRSQQPPVAKAREAVAMQVCGLLVLLGDFAVLGRIVARAYFQIRNSGVDTRDWRTALQQILGPNTQAWDVRTGGEEHQRAYTAIVTDARGNAGTGQGASKAEASRLAARDYLTRHCPEAVADQVLTSRTREPKALSRPPAGHQQTVTMVRRVFALPPDAEPWIAQAMLHSSYAYENKPVLLGADQCDNRLLAHRGAFVMEALRAAELTHSVIARTLAPTNEQGRLGNVSDASLRPVFDALGMGKAMLRGAGESRAHMDAVKAGAVQAIHAVAWRFLGCRLLETRPAVTSMWIEESDTALDAYSQLEQLSRILDVALGCTDALDGPQHGAPHRATITLSRANSATCLTGPPASAKSSAKTACAAEIIKRLQVGSDAQTITKAAQDPLARFLLEGMLRSSTAVTPRSIERLISLRLLGVTHLLAGDTDRFRQWAAIVERAVGGVDDDAAEAMRTLYIRCLTGARQGEYRALRSGARRAARDVARAITAGRPARLENAWAELSAYLVVMEALTMPKGGTLSEIVAEWAQAVPAAADVAKVADASRHAPALTARDIAMIRAVGHAVIAAPWVEKAAARVSFDEQVGGAALTFGVDGVDVGAAQADVLSLAVTIAPRLTWETDGGLLKIGMPAAAEKNNDDDFGVLAGAGLAALSAADADLAAFTADLAAAVTQLTMAADADEAAHAISLMPDPVAAVTAARRAERKADENTRA